MEIPDYGRRRADMATLHLSLPADLVRKLREVAYQKRRVVSHLCRHLMETALERMAEEDAVAARAIKAAMKSDGPGGVDRRVRGAE